MTNILKSFSSFPKYEYTQKYFTEFLASFWPDKAELIEQFTKSVCVDKRAICLQIEELQKLHNFSSRNDIWKKEAIKLAKSSIKGVMQESGLELKDVDLLITTSVTGFSIPSLDTVLIDSLDFDTKVKRLPLFGFGCLGGLSSLNRAHEYLKANKKGVVLVNAVELCSLTFQQGDLSIPNLVGSSLFADGSASVLLVGPEHKLANKALFQIQDYEAYFYKNTPHAMGWNIVDTGFQLVLDNAVPSIVKENIPSNVNYLLDKNHLTTSDLKFSISHPGGPKVLVAMQEALEMDQESFKHSWESLREHGNLSSVSILNVLQRSINQKVGEKGDFGIMAAMGPGFNSEITLIKRI
jgi:alkylresorcinol/alkylpyrone synthase